MSDQVRSISGEAPSRRPRQFSLRVVFLLLLIFSILFAVAFYQPRYSIFSVLMILLLLVPLSIVAGTRAAMIGAGLLTTDRVDGRQRTRAESMIRAMLSPFRFFGLCLCDEVASLLPALVVAVVSTVVLIGLWPAIREIGLAIALVSNPHEWYVWDYVRQSVPSTFSRPSYWSRLWYWELWSVGRWWLLFGAILLLWRVVLVALPRRWQRDGTLQMLARFFAFAPWLIVLEMGFLAGVWVTSPQIVPEPSTGFVVGIFSWDLWHWDCWLDRGWLIRGAVPTLVAGSIFFARVLRWPWPAAAIAGLLLIPIALVLSVACTVAYQNGFPPVF